MLKNKKWYRKLLAILEITLGVFLLDLGFFFFYTPANLVTGGGMGIALIINETFGVPSSIFLCMLLTL
ncbi:MAG: YitT family protein [Clostridium sp.]|nr:MAG: YitT family protein [Clostridium sp.]